MSCILVTGAGGFLGTNLIVRLASAGRDEVICAYAATSADQLDEALRRCNVIFHLAGANRPVDPADFQKANCEFTAAICSRLRLIGNAPKIIFSSSVQAAIENPYGVSKRQAEQTLLHFGAETGAPIRIYRLRNIFGKWSRPGYNSVVATFCRNIAADQPIQISDPDRSIDLAYVDDVMEAFMKEAIDLSTISTEIIGPEAIPSHTLTLGELAGTIQTFRDMRETLRIPDFSMTFNRRLYATYLSHVPEADRENRLSVRSDSRGSLAEFLKSTTIGQIFLSRTLPGVIRGNHYHHTKTEKFLVVAGEGLVRMRHILGNQISEYRLSGCNYQVLDIPPGFTHSIQNVGSEEMVTLFWASEIFDPDRPDTFYLSVDGCAQSANQEIQ
jgi:UDP-2-acetamido-2,6-beta-L-arabino-hexul-4-ose reductase